MREPLRVTLLSFRDLFATAAPFIALAVALLAIACWLLDPMPPRHVVLAGGQDQGIHIVAERLVDPAALMARPA